MSLDPVRVEDTRTWLQKAKNDIRAAELLLPESLVDELAFHCQQAVEKCLKAYLFWHGQKIEKTHDLDSLGAACEAIDSTLQAVLLRTDPLTQYAVDYRYPGPFAHPTEAEASEFIETAKLVCAEIERRIGIT